MAGVVGNAGLGQVAGRGLQPHHPGAGVQAHEHDDVGAQRRDELAHAAPGALEGHRQPLAVDDEGPVRQRQLPRQEADGLPGGVEAGAVEGFEAGDERGDQVVRQGRRGIMHNGSV